MYSPQSLFLSWSSFLPTCKEITFHILVSKKLCFLKMMTFCVYVHLEREVNWIMCDMMMIKLVMYLLNHWMMTFCVYMHDTLRENCICFAEMSIYFCFGAFRANSICPFLGKVMPNFCKRVYAYICMIIYKCFDFSLIYTVHATWRRI